MVPISSWHNKRMQDAIHMTSSCLCFILKIYLQTESPETLVIYVFNLLRNAGLFEVSVP